MDKKAVSPQLVEAGSVKIREVNSNNAVKQKCSTTSDKRKTTPVKSKESTKKKVAKSSMSCAEHIQQLNAKWSEHFSHLEAMLLARHFRTLQCPYIQGNWVHFL